MKFSITTIPLFSLLAALAVGCGANRTGLSDGGLLSNMCPMPVECALGSSCIGGRCVALNDQAQIVLSAEPPPRAVAVRESGPVSDTRTVRSMETIDLRLPRTRPVRGGVFGSVMGQNVRVEAQVQFLRSMSTLGETGVSTLSMLGDDLAGGIRTELAPGLYDAVVEPTDQTAFPPVRLRQFLTVREGAPTDVTEFVLQYNSLLNVSGAVLDRDVGAGVGGLYVRAVDAEGNAVSTRAVTTNGSGSFRLQLSPSAVGSPWSLEITSGAPISPMAQQLPPSRFVYRIAATSLVPNVHAGYEGLSITIPGLARFAQTAEGICPGCVAVEASVKTERLESVPSSTVYFHGSVIPDLPRGHVAWYESYARTNADGDFNVYLVPGGYDAVITPEDTANRLAITSTELLVPEVALRGPTLTVHDRASIVGRLQNSDGEPIAMDGCTVRAIPLRDQSSNGTTAVIAAREATVMTAPDGSYQLNVDPGRYVLLATPVIDTGFAAAVHLTSIDRTTTRANETTAPVPLVLDTPVIVRGRVLDASGAILPNARVRAAARVVLRTMVGGNVSEVALDVPLDSDSTNENGEYELLVPPSM